MSHCRWKSGCYRPSTYGGWRRDGINKILFRVLENHWDHIYSILFSVRIFFQTLNYLLSLILTKICKIWDISLVWKQIWYFWVGMTYGQNSVMPKFSRAEGGGERWWVKLEKNCWFLHQSIENPKFCILSKNQSPRSIEKGSIRRFFFF